MIELFMGLISQYILNEFKRKNGVTMNYTLIITPLIGAAIGYVTNYIAVKMLFRPLKPVKIGKYQLPFTPGIIPKEKGRLANAIGDIVGRRLVTKDGIEKMLLSDQVKTALKDKLSKAFQNSDTTFQHFLTANLSQEKADSLKEKVTDHVTIHLKQSLLDADIADLLVQQIIKSIKEYVSGGFLAMMINDSLLNTIGEQIGKGIKNFIETNGEEVIKPYVIKEYDTVTDLTLCDVKEFADKNEIAVEDILIHAYEYVVKANMEQILSLINISQIAKDQINQMDVLELEELILSVMKKELNAIVNLGALIGLVLGLINLLIR